MLWRTTRSDSGERCSLPSNEGARNWGYTSQDLGYSASQTAAEEGVRTIMGVGALELAREGAERSP